MAANVKITQINWEPDIAYHLAKAAGSKECLDNVAEEVKRGLAQLWQITGESSGYLVTRVEREPSGEREMVLVLGEGKGAKAVIGWAVELANNHGIKKMRTHITRPGLKKIYENLGWHQREIVMEWGGYGQ